MRSALFFITFLLLTSARTSAQTSARTSALATEPTAQPQQFQAQSSTTAATGSSRAQARAAALNATIGKCDCKIDAHSKVALSKPLGTATVNDFKNRPTEVSVVSDEFVLKMFQEMTVQGKIPFGFPEDGCFARAHEMAYQLDRKKIITTKVVATGKFLIDSEKAANGNLSWAWHIAPAVIVDDGKEKKLWVIDPSLFFEPVTLEAWLNALTAHPKSRLTSAYLTRRFVYHPNVRTRDLTAFDKSDLKAANRLMKRYLKRENLRDRAKSPDL